MAQLKGIDISRWQGIINWDQVKSATEFAFIKIGGSDDGFYPDGQAQRNASEARRVGILRGFYAYLGGAHTVAEEIQHIKNCIANIGGLQAGEVLVLDWEEHTADEVGYISGICRGLIDAGFPRPLVYMSLSRVKSQDWTALVQLNCGLYVAAWGNNDSVPDSNEVPGSDEWPFWAVWQYSSTGTVPGIAGRVDLDIFNGDADTFVKYGTAGTVAPAPAPTPVPTPPTSATEYIVVSGDTLSGIGAKYGTSWQAIYALNTDRISNPSRIFPGQALRVPGGQPAAQQTQYYTVVSGDTLSGIAAKFGTTWQTLYSWNQGVVGPDPNLIHAGQVLRVR